jgi:hypothetical protein
MLGSCLGGLVARDEELELGWRVCSWNEEVCVRGEPVSDAVDELRECIEMIENGESAISPIITGVGVCATINFGSIDGRILARCMTFYQITWTTAS